MTSMLRTCDAMVQVPPDEFAANGGFTVCLKPGQILLTPPGMILIDAPLGESSFAMHWNFLVPPQLAGGTLSEKVCATVQTVQNDMKKVQAADSDQQISPEQNQFLLRVAPQLEVGEELMKFLLPAGSRTLSNFIEPPQLEKESQLCGLDMPLASLPDLQSRMGDVCLKTMDKNMKLGKRVKNVHKELQELAAKSVDFVEYKKIVSLRKCSADDSMVLQFILGPSVQFQTVNKLDESVEEPSHIIVPEASEILSSFFKRCSDNKPVDPGNPGQGTEEATREAPAVPLPPPPAVELEEQDQNQGSVAAPEAAAKAMQQLIDHSHPPLGDDLHDWIANMGGDGCLEEEIRRAKEHPFFQEYLDTLRDDVEEDWKFGSFEESEPFDDLEHFLSWIAKRLALPEPVQAQPLSGHRQPQQQPLQPTSGPVQGPSQTEHHPEEESANEAAKAAAVAAEKF